MTPLIIKPVKNIKGKIVACPDKSITHRAVIMSALSRGKTVIENFLSSSDCLHTLKAFRAMGVKIKFKRGKNQVLIRSLGMHGFRKPRSSIFVGGSGTTMRLLAGILAAQNFDSILSGNSSLKKRPMFRIIKPLRMMGADITGRKIKKNELEEYPPLKIKGKSLRPIRYNLEIPSAQVKSCILLASLFVKGKTYIKERYKSRDHTERMLKAFGAKIKLKAKEITIIGPATLQIPKRIVIPGDISSMAFFIVATLLLANSRLEIKDVGLNPSRLGLVRILKKMGADIKCEVSTGHKKVNAKEQDFEPKGSIVVRSSKLKAITVKPSWIPSLIDELPILMVAACLSSGETKLQGIKELRVKETDRVRSMVDNLKKMDADIFVKKSLRANNETIVIRGVESLKGARLHSYQDHRTAMSLVIASLVADGRSQIDDIACISKSFPDFFKYLRKITSTK